MQALRAHRASRTHRAIGAGHALRAHRAGRTHRAIGAGHALRTHGAGRAHGTIGAGQALQALRASRTHGAGRTHGAIGAGQALQALRASRTHGAGRTHGAIGAGQALQALRAGRTHGAGRAHGAGRTHGAGRAHGAIGAGQALSTGGARGALRANRSGGAGRADRTNGTLRAVRARGTLRAVRARRTGLSRSAVRAGGAHRAFETGDVADPLAVLVDDELLANRHGGRVDVPGHVAGEEGIRHAPHPGARRHLRVFPDRHAQIARRAVEHGRTERDRLSQGGREISILEEHVDDLAPDRDGGLGAIVEGEGDAEGARHGLVGGVVEPALRGHGARDLGHGRPRPERTARGDRRGREQPPNGTNPHCCSLPSSATH